MEFKQHYHPSIDLGATLVLRRLRGHWKIKPPRSFSDSGEAISANGSMRFRFRFSPDHPVIDLSYISNSGVWDRNFDQNVALLILYLELGTWHENRVVVFRSPQKPENVRNFYDYSEERQHQVRQEMWHSTPLQEDQVGEVVESDFTYLHNVSRTEVLGSLAGTGLAQIAKECGDREWLIEKSIMRHISGLELHLPPPIPNISTRSFHFSRSPEPRKRTPEFTQIGCIGFCADQLTTLDYDELYFLVVLKDHVRLRAHCQNFWDWFALPSLVEQWTDYYFQQANKLLGVAKNSGNET